MRFRFVLVGVIIAVLAALGWQTSMAQFEDEEYFEATGHFVTGEFLAKYRSVPNPEKLFGLPITDAYYDASQNILVQYFQKTRFEMHADAPYGQRVQLSNLGVWLKESGQELIYPEGTPACQRFPGQDYQICYAFLDFYNAYGGEGQFGKPISNVMLHGDLIVQYFAKARFEWHPNRRQGDRVVLADLGARHFYREGNLIHEAPIPGSDTIQSVRELRVRAFPKEAVTGSSGMQTVHVIVQDQRLLPVPNAQVILVVRMPSGQESNFIVPTTTNELGVTHYTFPFNASEIGIAEIQATAMIHDDLNADTITSFRIWW